MRSLALILATVAGLGGCVYDPYYGYAYYPPAALVAAPVVSGAVVVTDPGVWPYRAYRADGYYHRYPYHRYPPGGLWDGRYHPYRQYPHGIYWHH